jgi:hypothetical protein
VTAPFDERGENFLSRWSRRKRSEPERREAEDRRVDEELAAERGIAEAPAEAAPAKVPADLPAIETLTTESDFSRFMRPDVPLATRTAAVKKLFTDPHFNLMDGLDIYIDDYTKPDPIPAAMLRDLAQSRMLKLFDDEPEDKAVAEAAPEEASAQVDTDAAAPAIEAAPGAQADSPTAAACDTVAAGAPEPQGVKPGGQQAA